MSTRPWSVLLAAAFLLLAAAAPLRAQTRPVPALPPEEPAADGTPPPAPAPGLGTIRTPADAETIAKARPKEWEYGLGVALGYDSNPNFAAAQQGSGFTVTPQGNLGRVFWNPKWQIRASGDGRWVGYPENSQLNRYYSTFGLDGSYRVSSSTSLRTTAAYGFGYTDSSRVLSDQGVLLPLAKMRTAGASVGVTSRLGASSTLRADVRLSRTTFAAGAAVAGGDGGAINLRDGQSERGSLQFERRLGARNTAGIEYALERTLAIAGQLAGTGHYVTHYGSLQWTRLFDPRNGLLLDAGASYTRDAVLAGLQQKTSFYGGVSYRRLVKRSTLLLFARREVAPAFGLSLSRLEDRFGLSAVLPFARVWDLRGEAVHIEPHAASRQANLAFYGRSDEASVSLGRPLGRRFRISGQSNYRRYGATAATKEVKAFQAALFVSFAAR